MVGDSLSNIGVVCIEVVGGEGVVGVRSDAILTSIVMCEVEEKAGISRWGALTFVVTGFSCTEEVIYCEGRGEVGSAIRLCCFEVGFSL